MNDHLNEAMEAFDSYDRSGWTKEDYEREIAERLRALQRKIDINNDLSDECVARYGVRPDIDVPELKDD